jgi:hypothetical protein
VDPNLSGYGNTEKNSSPICPLMIDLCHSSLNELLFLKMVMVFFHWNVDFY